MSLQKFIRTVFCMINAHVQFYFLNYTDGILIKIKVLCEYKPLIKNIK